jgi:hypothetical protein
MAENCQMPPNNQSIGTPLDQLIEAWRAALQETSGTAMLAAFLDRTRDILDANQLTRPWHDKDLPAYRESSYELRGPLLLLRQWRIRFYRLAISALIIALHERGHKPFGRDFWLGEFPELWQQVVGGGLPTAAMPISPSMRRPADTPFALRPDYRDWVGKELATRLAALGAGLQGAVSGIDYDPADPASFHAYGGVLSAASAILMADKLGLGHEPADPPLRELILAWLNPAVDDPFKFRFRRDSQLWPDWKYLYVDLGLTEAFAQVLQYDPADRKAAVAIRSLPLKEANTRTVGQDVVHTALRRIDIELAVWCEVAQRIRELGTDQPRNQSTASLPSDSSSAGQDIPAHLRAIIDKLREIGGTLDHPARTSRFAVPESAVTGEIRLLLDSPEWQLGDGIALIPPDLATPVLEDSVIRINLDWDWMSPASGWMELRLVALRGDGEPVFLEIGRAHV